MFSSPSTLISFGQLFSESPSGRLSGKATPRCQRPVSGSDSLSGIVSFGSGDFILEIAYRRMQAVLVVQAATTSKVNLRSMLHYRH